MYALMKKLRLFTLLSICIPTVTNADSDTKVPDTHQFQIGIEGQHYVYKEPSVKINFKSFMAGMNVRYAYVPNTYALYLESRCLYGKAKYDGFFSSGTPYKQSNIPSWISETRLLVSAKFPKGNLTYEPMAGIGYRYKSDHTSDPGYKRISQYWYVPIMYALHYDASNDWSISARLEYDIFLKGIQISHGTLKAKNIYRQHTGSDLPPVTHKQKSGYGLKAEVLAYTSINDHSVSFGPYFHYWNINSSTECKNHEWPYFIASYEPKNNTVEAGLKLSYHF